MPQAQIFISYRRDDAAGYARAVYDELARHFGAERVFMDVDDIDAGLPFAEVIEQAVGESKVLLVLIGRRWLGERDAAPRRIDEPTDFVAREVAMALAKRMRVIPVLLDGATMPGETQLPGMLKPLAGRNAIELGNARFSADIEHLVKALREALGEPAGVKAPAPARLRMTLGWAVAGALLAIAVVAAVWLAIPRGEGPVSAGRPAASAAPSATTRPDINGAWQAEVTYDWPGAHYVERFEFGGEAGEVHGSASFLGLGRGLLEGDARAGDLRFVTRTKELMSGDETVHRYRARLVGSELHFVMQTEGGTSTHVPVEFVARRVVPAASQANR